MPRRVPAWLLREMLHCATSVLSPCSASSSRHHVRAKKPRSSPCGASSIRYAPDNGNGTNLKFVLSRPAASLEAPSCREDSLPADESLREAFGRRGLHAPK